MTTKHPNHDQNPAYDQSINNVEAPSYGAPATSEALNMLYFAACDQLDAQQLAYLSRLKILASEQAESLSKMMMNFGCICANAEDNSAFPDRRGLAEYFWNLSHQLDHIQGLIDVASSAEYLLAHPKTEANRTQRQE